MGNYVYLTTAPDELDAEIMESLLEGFDIPIKKYFNNGFQYYSKSIRGNWIAGIQIYVSNEHLERAREALQINPSENNNISQERAKFNRNLAIFMLLPVLIGILVWILQLIHQ